MKFTNSFIIRCTILLVFIFNFLHVSTAIAQNYQWAKGINAYGNYGGIISYCITVDDVGNSYTVGAFNEEVDFDPDSGTYILNTLIPNWYNLYILKLDSTGNFVWAKTIEGAGSSMARSVILDNVGNLLITGNFSNMLDFDPDTGVFNMNSPGSSDIFVLKLNNNGQFIWAKSMGGSYTDDGRVIRFDADKNIYVSGSFSLTADFDPGSGIFNLTSAGSQEVFVSKLDSLGNFIWAKQFSGLDYDYANDLKLDNMGNCYITGSFKDSVDFNPGTGFYYLNAMGLADAFLTKLDSSGNFLWAKNLGGAGECESKSMGIDDQGMVYICGYFRNTCDFDPGPSNYNVTAFDSLDLFVYKCNSNGDFIWVKQFGGIGNEIALDLFVDVAAKIYFTGSFTNVADFDPGTGINNLTTLGDKDIFLGALDSSGVPIWIRQLGGIGYENAESLSINQNGSLLLTGRFYHPIDLNYPFNNILIADSSSSNYDRMFISRYDPDPLGIPSTTFDEEINLFPNPIIEGQSLNIKTNSNVNQIEIINNLGMQVYKLTNINSGSLKIQTSGMAPGMYIIRVVQEEKIRTGKLFVLH